MIRIMLVEDDPGLGTGLKLNLEYEGYEVVWARDLRTARKKNAEEKIDLILLDLNLPDGDGISLCTDLRSANSRVPIIILTAKVDEEAVVRGLRSGANDYVRKPFGHRELLARIQNALREPKTREDQLRFGDLLILKEKRVVMFSDQEIELSPREYDMLLFLVENGESVVSRERLAGHIDEEGDMLDRTIDSHVSHLRSKLKKAGITTVKISPVYGVGYMLEKT